MSTTDREDRSWGPYWRAVKRHSLMVAVIIVTTVVAALVWLEARTPTYEATSTILVTPTFPNEATVGLPILSDTNGDPTRMLQTAVSILGSPKAAVMAAQDLKRDSEELLEAVKVSAQGNSNVIAVTARAGDAESARQFANAYAQASLVLRADTLKQQVDTQIAGLRANRRELGDSDPSASAAFASSIAQLETFRSGRDPNFAPLQRASGADAVGASKALVLLLALFGGTVIAVGAALVVDQLESSVQSEEELVHAYPLPVLTRVPVLRKQRAESAAQTREAFRTLQVQLEDLDVARGRVVVFISASMGDGKTTSAIELSRTLLASGQRVILLDFDLRKPEVGRRLGVSSDVLSLFGSSPALSEALVEVPELSEGLRVFSGRPGGDSTVLEALLRQLPTLLAQAREMADVVVVDTAPIARVSDALRVAAFADDLVLVARPGNTDRNDLRVAREMLEHSGVTPSGMVVVGGASSDYGYYGEVFSGSVRNASPDRLKEQRPVRVVAERPRRAGPSSRAHDASS